MRKTFCCLTALALFSCGKTEKDDAPASSSPPTEAHVVLRKLSQNYFPARGAFAGETLGVLARGDNAIHSDGRTVVGIERDDGFELVNVGVSDTHVLAIAPAVEGFFALLDNLTSMYLAEVGLDGVVRSTFEIDQEPSQCSLDSLGATAVVACSDFDSAFVNVCSAGSCERVDLTSCEGGRRLQLACEGSTCELVRFCEDEEAEWTRFDAIDLATTAQTVIPLPAPEMPIGRVGMALFGGKPVVVFEDVLYELDWEEGSAVPVLDLARTYTGAALSMDYELYVSGDHLVILDTVCQPSLGTSPGDSTIRVFSNEYTELLPPTQLTAPCGSVSLAVSDSDRTVLLRGAPDSVVVEDFDVETGTRGVPRLFDGPAGDSRVEGMTCEGASCKLAVNDPGIPLSTSARLSWVDVKDSASEGPSVIREDVPIMMADTLPVLVMNDGQSVVFEDHVMWWLAADRSLVWSEPTEGRFRGFFENGVPYAAYQSPYQTQSPNPSLWRLSRSGPEKTRYILPENAQLCGTSHYYVNDGESLSFRTLEGDEVPEPLAVLPTGQGTECAAGQLVSFSIGLRPASVDRALFSGERLGVETLPGMILVHAVAGDSLFFLTAEVEDQQTPVSEFQLHELRPEGIVSTQILALPEEGVVDAFPWNPAPQVHDGYVHLVWKSSRNLMLSRWVRDPESAGGKP